MTREELERERDRLVKKYMAVRHLYNLGGLVPAIFVSSGYVEGFDQAVSLLMPKLERYREALEFYASACIDHEEVKEAIYSAREGRRFISVPKTYGSVARAALKGEGGE